MKYFIIPKRGIKPVTDAFTMRYYAAVLLLQLSQFVIYSFIPRLTLWLNYLLERDIVLIKYVVIKTVIVA